jgi:class 3 adenylate cyclase
MSAPDPTTRRSTGVLAWAIGLLTLALVVSTATLAVLNLELIGSPDEANAIDIVLPIGFAILGALVAASQPRNPVGWLFLGLASLQAISGATTQYTLYATVTNPGLPFTPWLAWIGHVASNLVYPAGLAPLTLMVIPNGRFLSRRWELAAVVGVLLTLVLVVFSVLDPRVLDIEGIQAIRNPTAVAGVEAISEPLEIAAFLGGLGILAAAGASVVLRLRRARGEERVQLRWVAYSVAFAVLINIAFTLAILAFPSLDAVPVISPAVVIVGFGIAMPVGFAVAMLRYRLYDLDLLVNRTVLYGAVSVLLLAVFGVANVLAQRALAAWVGDGSDLVAAGLGLAAGLAFGPVRRWLRPYVDRLLPARSRLSLLFTDIVESTQAVVDLGDEQWRDVLDRYRTMVRQELARCRGREVNTAGDAFFAVFDRPANALRCAIAMRDHVGELGLQVRTGLHLGDVEMRGEQLSGLAVHAAARVMGAAGPGDVMLSEAFAAALPDETPLRDVGRRPLRGVPGEWRLYAVP